MTDYIRAAEANRLVWFSEHALRVSTRAATVEVVVADITQAAPDSLTVAHAVNGRSFYESKKQEFLAYQDILLYARLNTPIPATPAAPFVGSLPARHRPNPRSRPCRRPSSRSGSPSRRSGTGLASAATTTCPSATGMTLSR